MAFLSFSEKAAGKYVDEINARILQTTTLCTVLIEPIEGGTENGKQNKILKKKYVEGNSKGVKLF